MQTPIARVFFYPIRIHMHVEPVTKFGKFLCCALAIYLDLTHTCNVRSPIITLTVSKGII
jgi:hypothetical protein